MCDQRRHSRVQVSGCRLLLAAIILGFAPVAFAAPGAGEVRFFSGVYLLQSIPGLSVAEKARRFSQLEQVTGIDARKAEAIATASASAEH